MLLSSAAHAQWLELPARPSPPAICNEPYAAMLAKSLMNAGAEQLVIDTAPIGAAMNYRRLVGALLTVTGDDAADESMAVVLGFKLYDELPTIDAAVGRADRLLHRESESDNARVMRLMGEFNQGVERRLLRGDGISAGEAQALVAPLREALNVLYHSEPAAPPPFDLLRGRAAVHDEIQERISEIATYMERGWAFTAWRPHIRRWHQLLLESLSYVAAVTDAKWLTDSLRQQCFERATESFSLFRHPQTRELGEQWLRVLVAEAKLLANATSVAQHDLRGSDVNPLRATIAKLHEVQVRDADERDIVHLTDTNHRLDAILGRMVRFRTLEREATPFELLRVRARLVDRYAVAEKAVLAELPAMATPEHNVAADPSMTALISEHRRILEDIVRLQTLPRLADAITLVRPASAARLNERLLRMAHQLADPMRRIDAAVALDQIEREVSRFWPMPFENELRQGSESAQRVTGNRHERLVQEIDALRDGWASELDQQGPAAIRSAAQRLELVYRLLGTIEDIAPLLHDKNIVQQLNTSDDWWMPKDVTRDCLRRIEPILQAAVQAAVEGNEPELVNLLRAVDQHGAVAQLIGRQANARGFVEHDAGDIALICRYSIEASHAGASGQEEHAQDLWRYANRIAMIALNSDGNSNRR